MAASDHAPGAYNADPDRFPEGFSIFIASGALVGLWASGSLRIPGGWLSELAYLIIIGAGIFGFYWATCGIVDRYTLNYEQ